MRDSKMDLPVHCYTVYVSKTETIAISVVARTAREAENEVKTLIENKKHSGFYSCSMHNTFKAIKYSSNSTRTRNLNKNEQT